MAIAFTSLTPAGSNIRHFATWNERDSNTLSRRYATENAACEGYLIVERAILSRSDSKYKVTIIGRTAG